MLWLAIAAVVLLVWLVVRLEMAIRDQRSWNAFVMRYGRAGLQDGARVEARRQRQP